MVFIKKRLYMKYVMKQILLVTVTNLLLAPLQAMQAVETKRNAHISHHPTKTDPQLEASSVQFCHFKLRVLAHRDSGLFNDYLRACYAYDRTKVNLDSEKLAPYGLALEQHAVIQEIISYEESGHYDLSSIKEQEYSATPWVYYADTSGATEYLGTITDQWYAAFCALQYLLELTTDESQRVTGADLLRPDREIKNPSEYLTTIISSDLIIDTPWGRFDLVEDDQALSQKIQQLLQLKPCKTDKKIDNKEELPRYKILAIGALPIGKFGYRLRSLMEKEADWLLFEEFFRSPTGQVLYATYKRAIQAKASTNAGCRCTIL